MPKQIAKDFIIPIASLGFVFLIDEAEADKSENAKQGLLWVILGPLVQPEIWYGVATESEARTDLCRLLECIPSVISECNSSFTGSLLKSLQPRHMLRDLGPIKHQIISMFYYTNKYIKFYA